MYKYHANIYVHFTFLYIGLDLVYKDLVES